MFVVYKVDRLRAGVRLIPEGRPANRSLSAIEPVSATAKRKLENGEQRPAPEARQRRTPLPSSSASRSAGGIAPDMVGPHADEVINIFGLAIRHTLTTDDLKITIFAYPTAA